VGNGRKAGNIKYEFFVSTQSLAKAKMVNGMVILSKPRKEFQYEFRSDGMLKRGKY
jgi:hypothetical protein